MKTFKCVQPLYLETTLEAESSDAAAILFNELLGAVNKSLCETANVVFGISLTWGDMPEPEETDETPEDHVHRVCIYRGIKEQEMETKD